MCATVYRASREGANLALYRQMLFFQHDFDDPGELLYSVYVTAYGHFRGLYIDVRPINLTNQSNSDICSI